MLWFNFILGPNFIFLCFKLIIIHYHTKKQRKIKFEPKIKLNHNIYTLEARTFGACSCGFATPKTSLFYFKELESLGCPSRGGSSYGGMPRKMIFKIAI